ncbi:MAG: EMC3/TMCO1 family protein [Candidatus Micrarchaeia archaeon]
MANETLAFGVISLIGLAYAFISIGITNRFGNRQRVKEIQKQINDTTKAYQAAVKGGDEAEIKKCEAEQGKMPGLLRESMVLQFKPLVFLLPFLLVLPAVAHWLFPAFIITLPFELPVFIQHFERFPNWRSEFGPVGWFWLAFLFSSLLAQGITGQIKKLREKKSG